MLLNIPLHYWWWVLALLLAAGEVSAGGFFLLWVGVAAAAMGIITWFAPGLGEVTQAVLFVVLAIVSCFVYWKYVRQRLSRHDDPAAQTLGRRGEQMVGLRFVLIEAISNGRGKARVGDGQWLVSGPDLPEGSEVLVVGADGALLKVVAAT